MDGIIYLDNAATSFPKPDRMHEEMGAFYRKSGVNPGRSGCDLALEAEQVVEDTRQLLTDLFNPGLRAAGMRKDPDRLVFTLNATHALNLVLRGTLGPGDHVVTTHVEHNSVLRPVHHLARDLGVQVTLVQPDVEGYVDPGAIEKALQANTRLVVVNHASNVTGAVQDIRAIGAVCAQAGVAFTVDAAQTAGVLPIDMAECHISFLAFTGHKGLLGPTGTGGLCVADHAEIRGTVWGGTGVRSASLEHLEEYPYRLEAGTLNVLGISGLLAGVRWLQEQGRETLYRHEMELLELLQDGLSDVKGVSLHGTRRLDRRVPILSMTVDGWKPADVGAMLDVDYGVVTRTGLQCAPLIHAHMGTSPYGTVRLSLGPFNTEHDVRRVIEGVRDIAAREGPWKKQSPA